MLINNEKSGKLFLKYSIGLLNLLPAQISHHFLCQTAQTNIKLNESSKNSREIAATIAATATSCVDLTHLEGALWGAGLDSRSLKRLRKQQSEQTLYFYKLWQVVQYTIPFQKHYNIEKYIYINYSTQNSGKQIT